MSRKIGAGHLIVGAAACFFVVALLLYVNNFGFELLSPTKKFDAKIKHASVEFVYAAWGQFGDFLGGFLNPVFGFLGLVLILKSMTQNEQALAQNQQALVQNEQALEQNAVELKLSRDEMTASRKVLEEQVKNLEKQRFEDTFFSMLSLHNEELRSFGDKDIFARAPLSEFEEARDWLRGYDGFRRYSRVLFRLLKLIEDKSPAGLDDGKSYSSMVRAFVGDRFLAALFISALPKSDNDMYCGYAAILEKYSFFEHMPMVFVGNTKLTNCVLHAAEEWGDDAFGESDEYAIFKIGGEGWSAYLHRKSKLHVKSVMSGF